MPENDDNTSAREAETENKTENAVEADNSDVTDWYQVTCETWVLLASTRETGPDKRAFVKCVSVVTESHRRESNATAGVFGETADDKMQPTGSRLETADKIASRGTSEPLLNTNEDTSCRIYDGESSSAMVVTRSRSAELLR